MAQQNRQVHQTRQTRQTRQNPSNPSKPVKPVAAIMYSALNHATIPLSWCFAKFPLPLQGQVVKNAFSWGLHFSAYAFAQEKLLTMVKNAFSWGSNSKISIFIPN